MFQIIVNPIAGKGSSLKALAVVEAFLTKNEMPFITYRTEYPKHATELAGEISEKGGSLLAMGGDGTFNEVLNGIKDFSNLTVGFIPCGTGNDYVRSLDIPKDLTEFLELIKRGSTGYTDFIEINGDKRSLNCAGTGMDVDVLEEYARMNWPNGKVKYYLALLKTIFRLKFHKLRLVIDGQVMEKSVMMIGAANGKYIGGGMPISPLSELDDGYLDVVFVKECKRRQVIPYLIKFLQGKHIFMKEWMESYKVKEAKIEVLDGGHIQMDGEVMSLPVLDCKCIHEVLKIYR